MAEKHYRSLVKAVSWRLTGRGDFLVVFPIVTNVAGSNGTCSFTNSGVTNVQQFYRLRSP